MKDKKMLMLGTALVTLSGLTAATRAKADTAAVGMSAVIVQALTLNGTVNLDFGTLIPDTALAGEKTIDPDDTNGETNVTSLVAGTAGQLVVNGDNRAFNVAAVAADTVACVTAPSTPCTAADTMAVDNFRFSFADGAAPGGAGATAIATATIPTDGNGNLYIGADLQVGINQAGGSYTGSFDVVVDYN